MDDNKDSEGLQYERGLKLRTEMFGAEAVDKRMKAFGDFGKPLQHIINSYAYGDVWSRTALEPATKSLAMIAMMAAAGLGMAANRPASSHGSTSVRARADRTLNCVPLASSQTVANKKSS